MAEFEDKLNSILGNQAAMNQIMALARSLSGDQPPKEEPPALENPAEGDTYVPVTVPRTGTPLCSTLCAPFSGRRSRPGWTGPCKLPK